ncbi:ABC transporter permease [Paenibacillus glucanolyticus]|uniref:ABC transporter permease n=1 Tax=Paenibacillus glucanolyticus TaxID=59843 RepID=UPI0034CE1252
MHIFGLTMRFFSIYIKSKFEYRFSFFSDIAVNIFTYLISYLGISMLLQRFGDLNGWNLYEILWLYNLNLFSYGISCFFFWTPMRSLEALIRDGSFDGLLIRPVNPFMNLIMKQSYHGFLGHIILGIVIFYICAPHLDIDWSYMDILYFVLTIIGAVGIHSAILIATGVVSFWTVKSTSVMNTIIYGVKGFIDFPISIYHKSIQFTLVFLIPYAFVNYIPAKHLLSKNNLTWLSGLWVWVTPFVGIGLFVLSYMFWLRGLKNYNSTG